MSINVVSFDNLIGKLFTHMELLGLTDRQLSALKSTTRYMFWDWYNNHLDNDMGYADPSHQARIESGIEANTTTVGSVAYSSPTFQNV